MESTMKQDCLTGKAAIVTGGRRGIGRAIAVALAEAGADVAVCDIAAGDGLLEETRLTLCKSGSQALAIQADISHPAEVNAMVSRTMESYGKIDILVNCAGVWIPGETLVQCSEENWDRVIDTNLKGTYLCSQAVGKTMIPRMSGCIINMSSQVGLTPGPGGGAYSVSKAGIIMLTRQLALELAEYRIRVNAVAPGIVKTEFNAPFWKDTKLEKQNAGMVPLGRLAEPEDIAQSTVFLASDGASYITGEVLSINGGWKPSSQLK